MSKSAFILVQGRTESWGSLIAFSHSIFALPFAVLMIGIIAKYRVVTVSQIALLIVCVVAARTAAMAFNRVVDAGIDAENPRTSQREIPSGRVSRKEGIGITALSTALFILASGLLGPHCLTCAPFVVMLLFGYSLMKRYSALCHIVLGCALACAPGGVWYALVGTFALEPIPMMASVLFWVAGFDILYSIQDKDFDLRRGLHSLPVALGERKARLLSILFHLFSVALLLVTGRIFELGMGYWSGVTLFAISVAAQHVDVARHGTSVIGRAFFLRNGVASILLCVCSLIEIIFLRA